MEGLRASINEQQGGSLYALDSLTEETNSGRTTRRHGHQEQRESKPWVTLVIMEFLIPLQRYSSLSRLLRVTVWIQRFVRNCRRARRKQGLLTAQEMNHTEFLVRQTQRGESVQQGILCSKGSPLSSSGAYLESNGILRVGGRLQRTQRQLEENHQSSCLPSTSLLGCLFARPTNVYFMRDFVTPLRSSGICIGL